KRTGDIDVAAFAKEQNPSVLRDGRVGLDGPRHVDQVVEDVLGAARRHEYCLAASGFNTARVGDQTRDRLAVQANQLTLVVFANRQVDEGIAVQIDRERVSGRERHLAETRRDQAVVADVRRHQRNQSSLSRGDSAGVENAYA